MDEEQELTQETQEETTEEAVGLPRPYLNDDLRPFLGRYIFGRIPGVKGCILRLELLGKDPEFIQTIYKVSPEEHVHLRTEALHFLQTYQGPDYPVAPLRGQGNHGGHRRGWRIKGSKVEEMAARIAAVMSAEPQRAWRQMDVAEAIGLGTNYGPAHMMMKNALERLKEDGRVYKTRQRSVGRWYLWAWKHDAEHQGCEAAAIGNAPVSKSD
jgi:hypothetical protein